MDLVAIMTNRGIPYDDACVISDLAQHAASEAQQAMTRVADTAPERLQVQVLMVTTLIMEQVVRDCKTYMTEQFSRAEREQL